MTATVAGAGVTIRRAGPGDLDTLEVLFGAYLDFYEVARDAVDVRRYLAGHLAAGSAHHLLAELPGATSGESVDAATGARVTGVATVGFAQLYETFDSLALARRIVLYDLFVAPPARGGGVGAALLDAVERLARRRGAVGVTLDTARDNHVAQRLYERAGYVRDDEFLSFHLDLTGRG
jgi:ribosomal protein S18 acetylase RimI-like enzyme